MLGKASDSPNDSAGVVRTTASSDHGEKAGARRPWTCGGSGNQAKDERIRSLGVLGCTVEVVPLGLLGSGGSFERGVLGDYKVYSRVVLTYPFWGFRVRPRTL